MDAGLSSCAIMPTIMSALKGIFHDNLQKAEEQYRYIENKLRNIFIYAETLALTRGNSYITVRDIIDACKSQKPSAPASLSSLCVRDVLSLPASRTHISVLDSASKLFTQPRLTIDTFYSFYKGRQPLIPQNPPIADIISLYDQFAGGSIDPSASDEQNAGPEKNSGSLEQENLTLVPTIAPELSFLVKEILFHAEHSAVDGKSYMLHKISDASFKKVSNALPQHLILLIENACEQGKLNNIISHLKVLLILILPYGTHFIPYLNILIPLMIKLAAISRLASDLETSSIDTDLSKVIGMCDLFDCSDLAKIRDLASTSVGVESDSALPCDTMLEVHKRTLVIRQLSASILSHLAMLSLAFDPLINEKIGSVLINTLIKNPNGICTWGLVVALTAVSSNNCIGVFISKLSSCPQRDTLLELLRAPSPQYTAIGLDGGWTLLKESVRARVQSLLELVDGAFVDGNISLSRVPLSVLTELFGADLLP